MGTKIKNSIFLLCLIYVSAIQPAFSSVAPPQPPQCGQSKAASGKGAAPWIGLLAYGPEGSATLQNDCAATLIGPSTLATTGQCADEKKYPNLRFVRLGAYDLSENASPEAKGIECKISKPILHPQYNPNTLENNIALLILEKPVQLSDAISPACLPVANDLKNSPFIHTSPTLSGWGRAKSDAPMSPKLGHSVLPVVHISDCKNQHSKATNIILDERIICAGKPEGGADNCQGNLGSPLTLAVNHNHYFIGVLSQDPKCEQPNQAGIYSRVGQHMDFILQNLA